MSDLMEFLKQADILYQLKDPQLEKVARLCQERVYGIEEVILEEGSDSKDLYIIASGEVNVLVNPSIVRGPGEKPKGMIAIATLERGQSFGEIALVDEGLRSATVMASRQDTRLLVIPRAQLIELCEADPQLGYRLMFNLAADLAMKIRNTGLRIREMLLYSRRQ